MATIDQFTGQWWKIQWDGSSNYFVQDSSLLIIADAARNRCDVVWLDANNRYWTIQDLSHADGHLTADAVHVKCAAAKEAYERYVDLWLEDGDKRLHGSLTHDRFTDGPLGTFTAVADPMGGERPDHRKPPFWRRWLHGFRRLIDRFDDSLPEERIAVS